MVDLHTHATHSRESILARLEEDLVGPGAEDELLRELPTDRYLTGILYPQRTTISADEDEELRGGGGGTGADDGDSGDDESSVRLSSQVKPATMGMSFSLTTPSTQAKARITIRFATYRAMRVELDEDGNPVLDENKQPVLTEGREKRLFDTRWQRTPHEVVLDPATLKQGYGKVPLPADAPTGLELHCQLQSDQGRAMVTLALLNNNEPGEDRAEREERAFFQVGFALIGLDGCEVTPRPFRTSRDDDEGRLMAVLYRNIHHHVVGHTCSAMRAETGDGVQVQTSWIPHTTVPGMNPLGGEAFQPLSEDAHLRPLSAKWLAESDAPTLLEGLRRIPACYGDWIQSQQPTLETLEGIQRETAAKQLAVCRGVQERIQRAVDRLGKDDQEDVRRCFQLANRAILLARSWSRGEDDLTWRPFQIAFILLSLESLADPEHADRGMMDLLWFPTGGGKTEAYLGLIAFLLFHRRLRHTPADAGAGTAAIMRYTLRALTIQQFQRAAGLVMACEQLRQDAGEPRFGNTAFSIGLWVGGSATPNTVAEAASLSAGSNCDHKQLAFCPCCKKRLRWTANQAQDQMTAYCNNGGKCWFADHGSRLPVYTIDQDIYRALPSLLIGTIDKFAQIARNEKTGKLFGVGTRYSPPDLIVQDELHLISGPLGTVAGLYETAIDHMCSRGGHRPKVLGSTATIRRAQDQIRNLFARETCQFPPPGLDHDDSGFAVVDPDHPGRLHVGITTAGRSPKFVLQAVSATLLQSATSKDVPEQDHDSYSTLLAYFNSLRELGGALVLMQDDVNATIGAFADRRGEKPRDLDVPEELTSRKSAAEIRELLEALEKPQESPAVLLASNMISVGVDIQRLSLMVVNGQPKTIAEYIQATSRVGRGATPGVIFSIYNSSRTRDRSHYESFTTWHEGIYREVEATSVTPFASRAVEKAVHAVFVSLVRHLIPSMQSQPQLSAEAKKEAQGLKDVILERVAAVDPNEAPIVEGYLDDLIQQWVERNDLKAYWKDDGKKPSLMISAEQFAALRASGQAVDRAWPTPNSMRDVEPSTTFLLGFPQMNKPQEHA